MIMSRLFLVLAVVTGAVTGTFGGGAGAAAITGDGLRCEATEIRHNVYTEGCAAVHTFQSSDFTYVVGVTEASAYSIVDGQRVPAKKVRVRIALSEIYVDGRPADRRACSCSPATLVQDATRNATLGSTAQAAVTYEVWVLRGSRLVQSASTFTVMSDVVATPAPAG